MVVFDDGVDVLQEKPNFVRDEFSDEVTNLFFVDETILDRTELLKVRLQNVFVVLGLDARDVDAGVLRGFVAFASGEKGLMAFAVGMIGQDMF